MDDPDMNDLDMNDLDMNDLTFTDEPLPHIIETLRARLGTLGASERLTFRALDPDRGAGLFAGEILELGGARYRHRPLRAWLDLAERLGCRLHMPERDGPLVRLSLSKLEEASWHLGKGGDGEGHDYGRGSEFSRVRKLEDPTFWLDYAEALERAAPPPGGRVLSLGVGRGDELEPFAGLFGDHDLGFTGVDRSASALAEARARFPGPSYRFVHGDLNELSGLELGRYDLVVSIATFQSPGVAGHALVREVVQRHLEGRGSLILALPNCRYRGGEVHYGAKMKNFARPDLSLLVRDAAFYRRYLQQHRFRVFVTGKYYLFLTAVRP